MPPREHRVPQAPRTVQQHEIQSTEVHGSWWHLYLVRGSLELDAGQLRDLGGNLDVKALLRVEALKYCVRQMRYDISRRK